MSDRPDFQRPQDIANQTLSEVDTAIQTQRAESILFQDVTNLSAVGGNGTSEDTFIRAPAGTILELLAINVVVNPDADATSGTHTVFVRSETKAVDVLKAESDFDDKIEVSGNTIVTGTSTQVPPTAAAQSQTLQGLRIDETNGLLLEYFNDTDAAQEQPRQYELWFREIGVA